MSARAVPTPGAITLLRENPYEFLKPPTPRRTKPRKGRRVKKSV